MADILVKLYDLAPSDRSRERLAAQNIKIRRPIGPEKNAIKTWIRENFSERWACEFESAFFASPKTMYIALKSGDAPEMLGFACYDATAKGFFGPIGVAENSRCHGVGEALVNACLYAMREDGYGYAVVGSAAESARGFYEKVLPKSSFYIPDSKPGVYKDML